mgnify:CR=1 FL=1
MDFEDLDTCNGDTIHDMYMDSDYEINTIELPEVLNEVDLYGDIKNYDEWDLIY